MSLQVGSWVSYGRGQEGKQKRSFYIKVNPVHKIFILYFILYDTGSCDSLDLAWCVVSVFREFLGRHHPLDGWWPVAPPGHLAL